MPSLTFNFSYPINEGLVLSPEDLKKLYFYGIPIQEKNGTEMSDSTISLLIRSAQEQIEGFLSLKLWKQLFTEKLNFTRSDFDQFGYVKTTYPVVAPVQMNGWIGGTKQIEFPEGWLSSRVTSDGVTYYRNIWIVPGGAQASPQPIIFGSTHPYLGYYGLRHIPNYWEVKYITGYDKPPMDIVTVIGKLASIMIFHQLGDIILGAGIASMSLGIDGLSQSISTTSSATNAGYGARITGYLNDLKTELPALQNKYRGIGLVVL